MDKHLNYGVENVKLSFNILKFWIVGTEEKINPSYDFFFRIKLFIT